MRNSSSTGAPSEDSRSQPGALPRALRRIAVAAALVLVGLLVGGVVLVIVAAQPAANYVAQRTLPELGRRFGLTLSIGQIHAHVFPTMHVELDRVTAVPARGALAAKDEPNLLDIERLTARVKVWPLVVSLGKRVEVEEIRAENPRLNLVRRKGGPWNYELERQRSDSERDSDRALRIDVFEVRGGQIAVFDRSGSRARPGIGGGPQQKPAEAQPGDAANLAMDAVDITIRNWVGGNEPVPIRAKARLGSDQQNIVFDGSLAPGTSDESASARGSISISEMELSEFAAAAPAQIAAMLRGALLSFRGALSQGDNKSQRLVGDGRVDWLSAGNSSFNATFSLVADEPSAATGAGSGAGAGGTGAGGAGAHAQARLPSLDITRLALHGDAVDLGGRASIRPSGGQIARDIRFELSGPRLDLAPFLAAAQGSARASAHHVPEAMSSDLRAGIEGMVARGTIEIASVRMGKAHVQKLRGDGTLSRGVFQLHQADAEVYGGALSLVGSEINLQTTPPTWKIHQTLRGFAIEQALGDLLGTGFLRGKASSELNLSGAGSDWAQLRDSVSGTGTVSLSDGALGYDLGQRLAQPLTASLSAAGLGGALRPLGEAQNTRIQQLQAKFTLHEGWAELKTPLQLDTPLGALSLTGRLGLSGQVELEGKAHLASSFLSTLSPALPQALTVPLTIRGSVDNPNITVALQPQDVPGQLLQNLQKLIEPK